MNDKANATTPAYGTPSELESEFRDGIPSSVDIAHCSYCGITEDIHLLDGVLVNEQDSDKISCIACYPDNGWSPTGVEHIGLSIAPSLKPHYDAWLAAQAVQGHAIPETVSDYFKRLYPEYYVQIITNINSERRPEMAAHLLSSKAITRELHCAFIWYASPEGDAFWRAVAQREA